jgi:hypothetical protein
LSHESLPFSVLIAGDVRRFNKSAECLRCAAGDGTARMNEGHALVKRSNGAPERPVENSQRNSAVPQAWC